MTTENENTTDEIKNLDVNTVYPNPDQPRKAFDEASLKELADSITKHGVIQPVTVVKTDKGYMIVAGERRFRATLKAGLKTVPAVVKNYDEKETKEVALLENLQREDLNPIEEARSIKRLMDEFALTQDEVAERLGKSRSAIANTLRLLALSPEVTRLVVNGELSAGHARALVTFPFVKQSALARKAVKDGWSVRELEAFIRKLNGEKPKPKPKKQADICLELRDLVERMQRVFGTKVSAIGNDDKGRIYVDYFTRDDLDRLAELIEYAEDKTEEIFGK